MKRFAVFALFSVLCLSCVKDNKVPTVEKSIIWPLKIGNKWHYKATSIHADGANVDTTALVLEIDSMKFVDANEYFSAEGDYSNWYRSAKGEVWVSDASGTDISCLARNTGTPVVIHEGSGTYAYFFGAGTFNGTLTRTANSQIVVIGEYNCTSTDEVYKNAAGTIVQKRTIFFSPNKGPICFKYYGNRETPGSSTIYLALQYIADTITIP